MIVLLTLSYLLQLTPLLICMGLIELHKKSSITPITSLLFFPYAFSQYCLVFLISTHNSHYFPLSRMAIRESPCICYVMSVLTLLSSPWVFLIFPKCGIISWIFLFDKIYCLEIPFVPASFFIRIVPVGPYF